MQTTVAKAGMRVRVFDKSMKELGLGHIRKVEPLKVLGIVLHDNYPSMIVLDNGMIVKGNECTWIAEE